VTELAHDTSFPPIVLLIDDDVDILEMYKSHFESEGVWIATAKEPTEGLSALHDLRPDIVVSDLGFNGGPDAGIELVRAIKSHEDTSSIPVIVLTGLPAVDLPGTIREGADLFLRKPVSAGGLLAQVRQLLDPREDVQAQLNQARARAAGLAEQAERLTRAASDRIVTPPKSQRCPKCQHALEWIERSTISGQEYDYFDWCPRGCGLYCFARAVQTWVKLA